MFHEVILGSTEKCLSNLHIEGAHIPLGIALVIVLAQQTCMLSLSVSAFISCSCLDPIYSALLQILGCLGGDGFILG